MKLGIMLAGIFAVSGAATVHAQPPRHIVGDRIGGESHVDAKAGTVTETTTLTFQDAGQGPVYTIDFTARHPIGQPVVAPGVLMFNVIAGLGPF